MNSWILIPLCIIAALVDWAGLVCLASLILRMHDKIHILLLGILPPLASLVGIPAALLIVDTSDMCCSLDFMPYAFLSHALFTVLFLALANLCLSRKGRPSCPLRALWFLLPSAILTLPALIWLAERLILLLVSCRPL